MFARYTECVWEMCAKSIQYDRCMLNLFQCDKCVPKVSNVFNVIDV